VDRNALNELVFDGLMTPRQYSPISVSAQAYPKQANAHIEYDVDAANALLDGAGYAEKNADGMRVWPGTTDAISFIIEGTDAAGSVTEDAVNQIVKYYAAVGVSAAYKYSERSLYEEHWGSNAIEAAFWGGDRTVVPLAAPIIWTCEQPDRPWAAAWALWDQIQAEADPAKQNELFFQILDIWAEELPMVGYLGEGPTLIIVKDGVKNYLPGFPVDDPTGDEHLLNTETYYWEA
jgi:peptide/nickel transport system substrate-binding protein